MTRDGLFQGTWAARRIARIFDDARFKHMISTAGVILFGNTCASLLNFVSLSIIATCLGASVFALVVLTETYVLVVNAIFNVQTWEAALKFGHSGRDADSVSGVMRSNLALDIAGALTALVFSVALAGTVVALFGWEPGITTMIMIYSLTIPVNLNTFKIAIPRLFDKFTFIARINIITALLKLSLVVLAAWSEKLDAVHTMGIYTVSEVFLGLALLFYSLYLMRSHGHGGWLRGKIGFDSDQLRFIWWTNLRSIVRIPVQYSDTLIISLIMPLQTIGIYKVYKEIAAITNRLGDPVNQALYPEYSRLIGKNKDGTAVNLAKKTIFLLTGLSVAATGALIIASGYLVEIVYGTEYMSQIGALYLMVILSGLGFATLPVNALFVASGFAKIGFYIVVFTNITYLATSFYIGKMLNIYGIITANALQMVFNTGLKVFFLKRYRNGWADTIR